MSLPDSAGHAPAKRNRLTLWLVLALCAAPVLASYAAFYFWRPSEFVNHGELLEPRLLPDAPLTLLDGTRFDIASLRGQWVLLVADSATCDDHCARKLTYIRQVRLAQGKEKDRVARLWLLTDERLPDAQLLAQHPELIVARGHASDLVRALPADGTIASHIYVVDPLGHLMMRYPPEADPRRILKDVARLLRHSKWK
jgi:cytochrome oxidase Cu insertion factor (SCO1/SenC/PrrC family)